MGRSYTPPYRLEMPGVTGMCWYVTDRYQVKGYGKPTQANLEKFVREYIESLKFGGSNHHISKALGYIPFPQYARIIRQKDNELMAEWKAAPFEIL